MVVETFATGEVDGRRPRCQGRGEYQWGREKNAKPGSLVCGAEEAKNGGKRDRQERQAAHEHRPFGNQATRLRWGWLVGEAVAFGGLHQPRWALGSMFGMRSVIG